MLESDEANEGKPLLPVVEATANYKTIENKNEISSIIKNSLENQKEVSDRIEQKEKTDNSTSIPLHSFLRRWFLREQFFWFYAEKLLLHFNKAYQKARRQESRREHWFLSNAVQLEDRSALNTVVKINVFRDGLNKFAYFIWPLIQTSIFFSETLNYIEKPTRRYEMPFVDLLSGFYRQQWGITGYYDGFPNQVGFWILPGSLLVLPNLFIVLEAWNKYRLRNNISDGWIQVALKKAGSSSGIKKLWYALPYSYYRQALTAIEFLITWNSKTQRKEEWINEIIQLAKSESIFIALPAITTLARIADNLKKNASTKHIAANIMEEIKPIDEQILITLKELTINNKNTLWREIVNYQLWTLGAPVSYPRHFFYAIYFALTLSLLSYTSYRYIQFFYVRSRQAFDFFIHQTHCHEQNKVWNYSPVTGEYACTVCGDWPFVPPQWADDPQACLNGLLAKPRAWSQMLDGFKRLRDTSSSLNSLDFHALHPTLWNETFARQFFLALTPLSRTWQAFNFSTPNLNPLGLQEGVLSAISDFLNQFPITVFDIGNQNIGSAAWINFLNRWKSPQNLKALFVAYNGFDDQSIIVMSDWQHNHSIVLKEIELAGNRITNNGFSYLFHALSLNDTQYLGIAANRLTGQGMQALTDWLSSSHLTKIDISQNDLTGADFKNFSQAIAGNSNLFELNLDQISMDDLALIDLSEAWKNKSISLKRLSVANNLLTGQGITVFSKARGAQGISAVNYAFNQINDEGLAAIQSILPTVNWSDISLSGNPFSAQGLANFWFGLSFSQITSIKLTHFGFDDNAFTPLLPLLEQGNLSLKALTVDNNLISNSFANQLFYYGCKAGIKDLSLAGNGLYDLFVRIDAWDSSDIRCEKINLANNLLKSQTVAPLMAALPELPLKSIDLRQNPITSDTFIQLAKILLTPIPNPQDLTLIPYSFDEVRALNHSHPNTHITQFYLADDVETSIGNRALCRVMPHLPDVKIIYGDETDFIIWENCQISSASRKSGFFSGVSFGQSASTVNQLSTNTLQQEISASILKRLTSSNTRSNLSTSASLAATFIFSAVPYLKALLLLFALYYVARLCWKYSRSINFWKRENSKTENKNEPSNLISEMTEIRKIYRS